MDSLSDGEITLCLGKEIPADPAREWLRALHFDIMVPASLTPVGFIHFRIGYTLRLVRYGGNIGYGVNPEWRGHHYAGKACRLVGDLAKTYGMDVLWITCKPANWASRKTCEWIGAKLVEIVDLPPDHDQYDLGEPQRCRYRWILY
jgi:tagatose 1,6-diphosphate aldolase